MRFGKKNRGDAPPPQEAPAPPKPAWQEHLDPQERPSRELRAADHSAFESILEPVPLPKWLRGRRRTPPDKLS